MRTQKPWPSLPQGLKLFIIPRFRCSIYCYKFARTVISIEKQFKILIIYVRGFAYMMKFIYISILSHLKQLISPVVLNFVCRFVIGFQVVNIVESDAYIFDCRHEYQRNFRNEISSDLWKITWHRYLENVLFRYWEIFSILYSLYWCISLNTD